MSELKFACPVCGQHIRCDSTKSGSEMECPTCFRKLVVPQRETSGDTKFFLAATEVQPRVAPETPPAGGATVHRAGNRSTLLTTLLVLVVLGAAAGGVLAFRDRLFNRPLGTDTQKPGSPTSQPVAHFTPAPAGSETNWTLNLADRSFPATPVAGRVEGRSFAPEKVTVQGGMLTFRHRVKTPEEMSLTIHLFARQAEDLALQNVNIESSWTNAPKVTLRWKDEQLQSKSRTYHHGYALKIRFGAVTNGRLPGRILLCVPDKQKSCLEGTFEAEIRPANPPKPQRPPKPAPTAFPKS